MMDQGNDAEKNLPDAEPFTARAESSCDKLKYVNGNRSDVVVAMTLQRFIRWRSHPKERDYLMKIRNVGAASLTLGIVLAFPQLTPVLQAQAQSQAPGAQQDQQKSQTFLGKVVKAKNGQFALLTDEQAGKGAFLDDQEKAKQFEGKNVKVTGVLEASRSLIHVSNIELA